MSSHEDCNRINPLLDAYLDGELSASESETVDQHVGSCDACKRTLAEIEQMVFSLKRLPPVVPPVRDFADDFEKVLAEKTQNEQTCQALRPMLDAYHDSELSDPERSSVAAHLGTCNNCRGGFNEIALIAASLRDLKPIEPPYDLANRFEEVLARKTKVVAFKKPLAWGAVGAVAAAVAALALHFGPAGPSIAPNTVATRTVGEQSNVVAVNSKPVLPVQSAKSRQGKPATALKPEHDEVANLPTNNTRTAKDVIVKQPPVVAQVPSRLVEPVTTEKTPAATRELAQLPTTGRSVDEVVGANSPAPEIAAYDPEHQTSTAEELGISTDEDGLYAIKL